MSRVFGIVPRSTGVSVTMAALIVLALFVPTATRGAPPWISGLSLVAMLSMLAVFGFFLYSSRRTTFTVSEEGLVVGRTLYGRSVPAVDLEIEDVKVLDLTRDTAYRVKWRTNGLGLPDYSLGWHILRNKEKALVFVTDRHRVVRIPTRSGFSILLSTPSPERFVQALQSVLVPERGAAEPGVPGDA